jgi:hypothetical protein
MTPGLSEKHEPTPAPRFVNAVEAARCARLAPPFEPPRVPKGKRVGRRPYNVGAHPRRAESRYHRSAGTRGARERAPCVGCSAMLYGSSRVAFSPDEVPRDDSDASSHIKPRATRNVPSQLRVRDNAAGRMARAPGRGRRSAARQVPALRETPRAIAAAMKNTGASP